MTRARLDEASRRGFNILITLAIEEFRLIDGRARLAKGR
jgi:hypothetical protein